MKKNMRHTCRVMLRETGPDVEEDLVRERDKSGKQR
jgi:hypothetical protein